MTDELMAVLARAKAIGTVKGLHVIHTLRGEPYSYHGAQSAWERACKRAGVQDAHFHDLRHRALTDAKRQGRNAQKLGGHSTEKMTARYIEEVGIEWIEPPTIGGIC